MDMTALVRNANLWTELGTVRQHRTTTKRISQPNFAYITQPISRSLTVRGIFPCPVANGIEIKRNTRHAARTASTCFGTSTILFERWRRFEMSGSFRVELRNKYGILIKGAHTSASPLFKMYICYLSLRHRR